MVQGNFTNFRRWRYSTTYFVKIAVHSRWSAKPESRFFAVRDNDRRRRPGMTLLIGPEALLASLPMYRPSTRQDLRATKTRSPRPSRSFSTPMCGGCFDPKMHRRGRDLARRRVRDFGRFGTRGGRRGEKRGFLPARNFDAHFENIRLRTAPRATALAIQTLGGYGFTVDFPQAQFYRDIRIMSIYRGFRRASKASIFWAEKW